MKIKVYKPIERDMSEHHIKEMRKQISKLFKLPQGLFRLGRARGKLFIKPIKRNNRVA